MKKEIIEFKQLQSWKRVCESVFGVGISFYFIFKVLFICLIYLSVSFVSDVE